MSFSVFYFTSMYVYHGVQLMPIAVRTVLNQLFFFFLLRLGRAVYSGKAWNLTILLQPSKCWVWLPVLERLGLLYRKEFQGLERWLNG